MVLGSEGCLGALAVSGFGGFGVCGFRAHVFFFFFLFRGSDVWGYCASGVLGFWVWVFRVQDFGFGV